MAPVPKLPRQLPPTQAVPCGQHWPLMGPPCPAPFQGAPLAGVPEQMGAFAGQSFALIVPLAGRSLTQGVPFDEFTQATGVTVGVVLLVHATPSEQTVPFGTTKL